jgi:Bcr/CflA subfamily drug resistance transporter
MSKSLIYVVFVGVVLASLGQILSDMYVPSMVAISSSLHTSINLVQSTISWYMFGLACSRLMFGPISDALGRRNPLIFGMLLCLIGSVSCIFATSIYILIIGRLLQGLGAGVGSVISGAIVRDLLHDKVVPKAFSFISMFNILAISTAPFLGGYVGTYFGWRANFVVMCCFVVLAFCIVIFFLQETNKYADKNHLMLSKIRQNITQIFKNKIFLAYAICVVSVFGMILVWITLGPVLSQEVYKISPIDYGCIALIGGISYAFGAFCNTMLVKYYMVIEIITLGSYIIFGAGASAFVFWYFDVIEIWALVVPVVVFSFGASIVLPNSFASAILPFKQIAGTAGAVLGFTQGLGGGVSSAIVALLPDNSQLPIAVAYIVAGVVVFCAVKYVVKLEASFIRNEPITE